MTKYNRLTLQERCQIQRGIELRLTVSEIARRIGRPVKTVSGEIRKNGGYLRYYAKAAHAKARQSKRKGYCKISSNEDLVNYIIERLDEGWHPEIIARSWNDKNRDYTISHESIYKWIYKQTEKLYLKLPRRKKKRGLRPQRNKSLIPNRVSIHQRPKGINKRSEYGDWEGDLIFQRGNKSQNILTAVERKTRQVIILKNDSKHSDVVIGKLKNHLVKSKQTMNSITFDNGSEFFNHLDLGVKIFFCDPGAPWQKGSVENFNGMLRRYIDYRIDINTITQEELDLIADKINNKPRKILKFLTPNELARKLYNKKTQSVIF